MSEFLLLENNGGKVGVRTHHINGYKYFKNEAFRLLDVYYKIGTPDERERFFEADEALRLAVKENRYYDLGENPDAVCEVCLNFWCPESLISRVANEKEMIRRRRVYEIIDSEIVFGRYPKYENIHDYTCRRVDELWNADLSKPCFRNNDRKRNLTGSSFFRKSGI